MRLSPVASRLLHRSRLLAVFALATALLVALGWSFWASPAWLKLCAGLALFLFGMQCLEDGLRALAGSRLERLIGRSTDTPRKGLLFGVGATMALQSSTLVALLTIAFVSTGLLSLAGALPILFGANLGATSGIWLLAMAGQNFSLAPAALPLLVIGVLGSAFGPQARAGGRVLLGIAFIFLGIDWLKDGFDALGNGTDLSQLRVEGVPDQLLFTAIGLLMTVVLQSSHATLMLTLAALASGQIDLLQGMAIAVGSNVGSSVSTAVVGMLGSHRGGQRLALAHVLFNGVTAIVASLLLVPLAILVRAVFVPFGLQDNALLELALFHTLFNAMGVLLFWPWQAMLARVLIRWLPDRPEPAVLIPVETAPPASSRAVPGTVGDGEVKPGPGSTRAAADGAASAATVSASASAAPGRAATVEDAVSPAAELPVLTRARYLSDAALRAPATATMAIARELLHLERLSLEVICHAVFVAPDQLAEVAANPGLLEAAPPANAPDATLLYQQRIKGVYSDLLSFLARLEKPADETLQQLWGDCNLAALQLVDAVKDAGQLQHNLGRYLRSEPSEAREAYVALRRFLVEILVTIRETAGPAGEPRADVPTPAPEVIAEQARVQVGQWFSPLDEQAADFDLRFRARLIEALRQHHLDGLALSSLVNDLGYANSIVRGLRNVLALVQGHAVFQALWQQAELRNQVDGGGRGQRAPSVPAAT